MIPDLPLDNHLPEDLTHFLKALKDSGFNGDISLSLADRICLSTDNSVYQSCPEVVVFPKVEQDIIKMMSISSKPGFKHIKFTPRGGGTGTNGQSLNNGVMVDFSKYMRKILEIDEHGKWVRVQPGVILDELNDVLKKKGVCFPIAISPSNRATIGGMYNTDACGKGSMVYGRTSEHIIASRHVMHDGKLLISDINKKNNTYFDRFTRSFCKQLHEVISPKSELISRKFPKLQRFLSGYNLHHALWNSHDFNSQANNNTSKNLKIEKNSSIQDCVNLNSLVSGSEGTLTFCTEITLKLSEIPASKTLVVLGYSDVFSAIEDGLRIKKLSPLAIEVLDENLVNLAKNDEVYLAVKDVFPFAKNLGALNLVEFNCKPSNLPKNISDNNLVIQSFVTSEEKLIKSFWNIRKKGVGLLAAMEGSERPVAFVEDPVVPPEKLPAFVKELKKIFDSYGLKYGLYGHVDVGCLHVRPALDLTNKKHQKWLVEITHKVNKLVKKYGGLLWAEHGKGYRGVLLQDYVGDELYHLMREVKTQFDPNNKMNPGKIATSLKKHLNHNSKEIPENSKTLELKALDDDFKANKDMQIPVKLRDVYKEAFLCNGNAQCMTYETDVVMCPSYKPAFDRLHSPKGRSMLIREWLSQVTTTLKNEKGRKLSNKEKFYDFILKTWNFCIPRSWILSDYVQSQDFSHQVYRSMSGCLGCKSCASSCPVKVNIPHMRAKFLSLYHEKFGRSWQDYAMLGFSPIYTFRKKMPVIAKVIIDNYFSRFFLDMCVGLTGIPRFKKFKCRKSFGWDEVQYTLKEKKDFSKVVCLIDDQFNSLYEPYVIEQTSKVIESLGYEVLLLSIPSSGIIKHNLGMITKFEKIAKENIKMFNEISNLGVPILCVEPSVGMCFNDEYKVYFPNLCKFSINLINNWMINIIQENIENKIKWNKPLKKHSKYSLFSHCIERSLSPNSINNWHSIFSYFGVSLQDKPIGCCGMAGLYGHLKENRNNSIKIYNKNWSNVVKDAGLNNVLATGFSCRCQIKLMEKQPVNHPLVELSYLMGL